MFRNMLLLYWLLFVSILSAARADQIKNKELSVSQQRCVNYVQQATGRSCTLAPYMALLGNDDIVPWIGFAGFIVSHKYILTSAYAVTNPDVKRVAVGVTNMNGVPDAGSIIYKIIKIVKHANYEYSDVVNDLALLKTETPIQFSDRVQPACLPAPGDHAPAQPSLLLTSFMQSDGNWGPARTMPMTEHADEKDYSICTSYNRTIHMCLAHRDEIYGGCESYSGDPVVLGSAASKCVFTVVAVKSKWPRCLPTSLYTRLTTYVPWVESVIWPKQTRR